MNHKTEARIRERANQLLHSNKIHAPPVDVEAIASGLGMLIRRSPTQDDVSGFLLPQPNGTAVIGVNSLHHPNRQRFTIAHEIGHFLLHEHDQVHVDKFVVRLRSGASSTGENKDEVEANRFAAELLMPADMLKQELQRHATNDLLDDKAMQRLARCFQVSVLAMSNRLVSLGYISASTF